MATKKYKVNDVIDKNIKYRGEMQYAVEIRRKSKEVHETFTSLDEARIYRDKVLSEIRAGTYVSSTQLKHTTFADLIDHWLERYPNASPKERNRISFLKTFSFSQKTLAKLGSPDFATFKDERLKTRAPDTVRNDLVAISKLYELARKEWGYRSLLNPIRDVNVPKGVERDRRLHAVEVPHLKKALEGGRNPFLKYVVLFSIESAMRLGEIAALTWNRVNLEEGTAKLRAIDTKTKKPRTVTLTDEAIDILRTMEAFKKPNTPVFHCSEDAIDKGWDHILHRARQSYIKSCEAQGVEPDREVFNDLRFHDLRHEATSRLVSRLRNVSHVQGITGHKTLSQLNRYTHLAVEEVREALNRTKPSKTGA